MRLLVAGMLLALSALSGCGPAPEQPAPEVAAGFELPQPRLDDLEPHVRERLEASRRQTAKAIESAPDREAVAAALGGQGQLYHAYALREAARVCYREAARLQPQELRWPYYVAQLALAEGSADAAAEGFEQALLLVPDYPPALAALAELRLAAGELTAVGPLLERALKADPACARAWFVDGQLAAVRGDHALAARRYERVLALQPAAAAVRYPLAQAYQRLGRERDAAAQLERRGRGQPGCDDPLAGEIGLLASGARVHMLRGSRAMRERRPELAAREFARAVELAPEQARPHLNLGAALAQLGRHAQARAQLQTALTLELEAASRSKAHFNLGQLAVLAGDTDEARSHFQQALELDPENRVAAHTLEQLEAAPAAAGKR